MHGASSATLARSLPQTPMRTPLPQPGCGGWVSAPRPSGAMRPSGSCCCSSIGPCAVIGRTIARPPPSTPPRCLPVRRMALSQVGAKVSFNALGVNQPLPGSPLAIIETYNRLAEIEVAGSRSGGAVFWENGESPSWAEAWDRDEQGAWVEFAVEDSARGRVTQRMRWIEPGTFLTGSPQDEPGRYSDEGPRRMPGTSTTCWAMSGSGSRIPGTRATRVPRRVGPPGRRTRPARGV
jgi:hypothetical protein